MFGAASFLRAEAELSVLAPSEAMVDAPTGRGGSFSALTFGGRVCALATFGRHVRRAIDTAGDGGDQGTADLFTGISRECDKLLWFVEAHVKR